MDSPGSNLVDIYTRYCEIISINEHAKSKEELALLSKLVDSRGQSRSVIFDDLSKLMSLLNLTVDSHSFTCFYGFVFFICRENGQKNIGVRRAVAVWRLVLTGRFRLLNQWCEFVEKHHRHNISEDTWQQLLPFSRCIHEDLEGYDPKGAWPILIDEFVEHMYRITQSNSCSTRNISCDCGEMETQPCMPGSYAGLRVLPGMKRKSLAAVNGNEALNSWNSMKSEHFSKCQRSRQIAVADKQASQETNSSDDHVEVNKHNQLGRSNSLSCAIEGSLLKGFEGLLSMGHCFQFDQGRRVSFT
ncbi:defective in cullin neddylation protein AAR3-like isoform X2 [Magnolia sinica]|uniref:defective in cullin neddylation protein AAR3-like isoform X2 n=1 Tax=Magnolia sinica TaxID=86752 RepID=UPI00265AF000|nr:defective in cullin neddylation protein AAR3-like isoform X2 [Magnolia sinica]